MQLLRRFSFTMLLMSMMTLVACGDGDLSGTDDTGGDDSTDTVTVTVTKSEGDLSAANNVTVFAMVLDGTSPVSDKTVTFTLAVDGSATFDPISGTATTDETGLASIVVKVTDVAGSVNVIASYSGETDDISFNSAGDGVEVVEGELLADSIQLFASSPQLASSGAQSIELIAIAKDESNNLLEGVTINFSSDSGSLGDIDDGSNVTGADGQVSKYLMTQVDPTNRIIVVSVTSGDVTDSLEVEVVGTTLTLTGSASLSINDEATYIVNVLDSDGVGVAKTDVALSLSGSGASITLPNSVTTDSDGQATIQVTGTSGGDNTIVASALGATASQSVSVQSDSFLFTSFSNGDSTVNPSNTPIVPDVSLSQTASVTLTWLQDGAAVEEGTPVSITTTRGIVSSDSETTSGGQVTVTLTSSDAGKALVTLVGTDGDIELTNQLEFEFYAEAAATIKAQASPNSIGPDQQTSAVSVVVKDVNGNLVKNKKIKFSLTDVSGGSIFPATAVTDSSGSASTIYTSNSTSAKDAVLVTAVVEDTPTVTDTVSLTVSNRELFISLGTGNELEELGTTDYVKEYSVIVSDAESNAVEGVEITISALPYKYRKGYWLPLYDEDEAFVVWSAQGANQLESLMTTLMPNKECDNEDINFDGILDSGEDFNGDLQVTPGNKVAAQSTVTTDADGRAVVRLIYAQSYADWLDIKLVASSKVTGSESSTQTIFTLPVLADDVNKEDITPPTAGIGTRSPFGLINDCALNVSNDPNLDGS